MFDINCIINDCLFCENGKCTLTHVSTPSNVFNPDCVYYRPKKTIDFDFKNKND